MLVDNNNSQTFKPVASMIVGKSKLMHLGYFRTVDSIEEKNLYGLRSEIINSPPATINSLKKNHLFLICLGLTGHSEEFRIRYLRWEELVNVNYEQISFLKLLGSN